MVDSRIKEGNMEAKDTVMHPGEALDIMNTEEDRAPILKALEAQAKETWPIAFKAGEDKGKQEGIKLVVDWIEEHTTITYGRAPLKIKWQSINPVAWQAFLKGGLEK